MALSCSIIPKVRKQNGELTDSKLFKSLSVLSDRQTATDVYQRVKHPSFVHKMGDRIDMDENGEPTFASIYRETSLRNRIPRDQIRERMADRLKFSDKGKTVLKEDKSDVRESMTEKAIEFNANSSMSEFFTAVIRRDKSGKIGVVLENRTAQNTSDAAHMRFAYELNKRIREILNRHGVSIGRLEDSSKGGVTDFSAAERTANGMIEFIRIAEGEVGEHALPEEFVHWALEAMGENPLLGRLMTLASRDDIQSEVLGAELETYKDLYKNRPEDLVKEVAGKLVAKYLYDGSALSKRPYRSFLQRVIDAIKNFISSFKASDFTSAVNEAREIAYGLAADLMEDSDNMKIANENIKSASQLFQIVVTEEDRMLAELTDAQRKRANSMRARRRTDTLGYIGAVKTLSNAEKVDAMELDSLTALRRDIWYISQEGLQLCIDLDEMMKKDCPWSPQEKLRLLRDVREFVELWKLIAPQYTIYKADALKGTLGYDEKNILKCISSITKSVARLRDANDRMLYPLFAEFIKPYLGDKFFDHLRRKYKKDLSEDELIEKLLHESTGDIGIFERWLDCAAVSHDDLLKIMDQIAKQAKFKQRRDTLSDAEKILAIASTYLSRGGTKDFTWMFEKGEDGKRTGDYISRVDTKAFARDLEAEDKRLASLYDASTEEGRKAIKAGLDAWIRANGTVTKNEAGKEIFSPGEKYISAEYKALTEVQREFFDAIMEIKAAHDNLLPPGYTSLNNAPKIHKDFLQRITSSDSASSLSSTMVETVRDKFLRRCDDAEFGSNTDEEGMNNERVMRLPILYTAMREGESAEDMSTDVVSTMIAYCDMCNGFNRMNDVVDVLETARDIAKSRTPADVQTSNVRGRLNALRFLNRKSLTSARIDDFMEMQVYQRYMNDDYHFKALGHDISFAKISQSLLEITALNSYALNLNSGISNVATGTCMMAIEAMAKQFFTPGDLARADSAYFAALGDYIGDIGNPIKSSKLALFMRAFNTLQDSEKVIRGVDWNRVRALRIANSNMLYIFNTLGEHWMQNRTAIALAFSYKMIDSSGNETNLWDALEAVPIDPAHPEHGRRLKVKDGYTKQDGTEFNLNGTDAFKFERRSASINHSMHGIYNYEDSCALQKLAVGRMGIMYRKWMRPSWNKRFRKMDYNFDLDEITEGYYRTGLRYLINSFGDPARTGEFGIHFQRAWNNMEAWEKANVRRMFTEVGIFLLVALAQGIRWPDDESSDSTPWLVRMGHYQSARLYSELGAMVPFVPTMYKEGLRIIKNPTAAVRPFSDLFNMLTFWYYLTDDDIIRSGRYKGMKKGYRYLIENPFLPIGTIQRALHPEDLMTSITNTNTNI